MVISRRGFLVNSALFTTSLLLDKPSYSSEGGAWPVLNKWDQKEFDKYSEWVGNLYKKRKGSRLGKLLSEDEANLLNNPVFLENGNSQISKDELGIMTSATHCGSFPELLFLYYSYRRGSNVWRSFENIESLRIRKRTKVLSNQADNSNFIKS